MVDVTGRAQLLLDFTPDWFDQSRSGLACHAARCITDHVVLAQLDLSNGKYGKSDAHFAGNGLSDRGAVYVHAGIFDELFVFKPAGSGETHYFLVRRDFAVGAHAMAADAERRLLDGTLDSSGLDPNGGAGYCAIGL